jgi:D-arabinose 1-dehydrogenase-like Zn-dependent alcohol dehydrogenase
MKAMIYTQYGAADVIHAAEVPPPAPKDNEVLIKIHAASINSADYRLMHGQPFMVRFVYGLFKPRHTILGSDIAGRVEAVGKAVTQFKVGDEVYGDLSNAGWAALRNMLARRKMSLCASRRICRLKRQPPCRWQQSPRCKRCVTRGRYARVRGSPSTARRAASARSPCRSPRRSAHM